MFIPVGRGENGSSNSQTAQQSDARTSTCPYDLPVCNNLRVQEMNLNIPPDAPLILRIGQCDKPIKCCSRILYGR